VQIITTSLFGLALHPTAGVGFQDTPVSDAVTTLVKVNSVEWIDWTALVLLGVFFLLGLFKGFWWQFSRVATLVIAWFVAVQYGPKGAKIIHGWLSPNTGPEDLPLFLSYVALFVLSVIALSVVSILLYKLIQQSGLSFYDRLAGAVLGLGTGGLVIIALIAGFKMFVPGDTPLVQTIDRSHTMSFSSKVLGLRLVKSTVPQPLLVLFGIEAPATQPPPAATPDKKTGK
jgi:uncharacterized membrane protein required for colicin V production